ncbi:hypothetical protein IFM89_018904 [Coptis chinensis]|uniref:Peptidase C1A papain C-terminal domain-containing protein n=1 Tax=Coptis chinensis TaxID=261450 RepID=A0A835LJ31_9MAGN|nr:hypothetical protein IFM89_018904 [Coptis chinensis]
MSFGSESARCEKLAIESPKNVIACFIVQQANLWGAMVSYTITSATNMSVISIDEEQIAANLVKNGPLAVGINAAYICTSEESHAKGETVLDPDEFNSWGQNWGKDGFYKICMGPDVCGVDSMVSTVAAVQLTPK